jgi:putative transposase
LIEYEAGATCADLCRKHGMSKGTFYNWKAKFGGMTVPDAKRLKALEYENARLKKLLAEQMLDAAALECSFAIPTARSTRPSNRIPPSYF